MTALTYKPAWELADLIARKEISPLELMRDTLERIERINPDLNAFVALCPEAALAEAAAMTEAIAKGEHPGPLAGLPLGVKDLEDTAGMVTSYGSIPFKDNMARGDSIQVARLKAAGAIVVGKTNVPEFGFTGFTKNRLHGITRNPWNVERTPGGSSGGAAAAIAGGLVPLCTGSDAGGSIRIPSSYSGCFGIKPTFGRIPAGPAPFVSTSTMIVMGPVTRCVRDAALYLDCTAGQHAADPYSLPAPATQYLTGIEDCPRRLKIAFSPDLGYAVVQKEIMSCVEKAVKAFEEMGHAVELWSGSLPDTGDVWGALVATDIYAQLCEELEKKREQIASVILAAGESIRMGKPKMLLPYGDTTIIETVVSKAKDCLSDHVRVVLGANAEAIQETIAGQEVEQVLNAEYTRGMLSSVQAGIRSIPTGTTAVMILLGDQPMIPVEAMDRLIQHYKKSEKNIIIASTGGKRGHPMIFSTKYIPEILAYGPGETLRDLITAHPGEVEEMETGQPEILRDIDTPRDYENEIKNDSQ